MEWGTGGLNYRKGSSSPSKKSWILHWNQQHLIILTVYNYGRNNEGYHSLSNSMILFFCFNYLLFLKSGYIFYFWIKFIKEEYLNMHLMIQANLINLKRKLLLFSMWSISLIQVCKLTIQCVSYIPSNALIKTHPSIQFNSINTYLEWNEKNVTKTFTTTHTSYQSFNTPMHGWFER